MPTIAEALAKAIRQHQAGELQAAEQIYRQILAVDPNHADALNLLGVIALQMGQAELAVQCIGRAIESNGSAAAFHGNLGNAFRAQGELNKAVACFERAVDLKPENAASHYNLANAYHDQGKLDEAIGCFRQALNLRSDYAEAHNNLGTTFLAQGKLVEAADCFRQTLKLKPDFAAAHYNLGSALQALGQRDEAIGCFRRALELEPENAEVLCNLGNALQAEGHPAAAINAYRRALQLKPDLVVAHFNLGNALQAVGKSDEAIDSYGRALELRPDAHESQHNLGRAFQAQGKFDRAIECFRRSLELNPNFPEAHNNLGNVLWAQGRRGEAVECYRQALELEPDYAEALSNLANAFQWHGKTEAAFACCRRALELKPDYAEAHNNLGNAFQAQGKLEEAHSEYFRALELKPDFAEAHTNIGQLLLQRGDFERGWDEYEWRWKTWQPGARHFEVPRWNGEPLTGKTILLYAEQGLGDTIHFVRYAAMVKALGATVVVECQKPLVRILTSCTGIDQLVGSGSRLPRFDFQSSLMSLPRVFKTDLSTIPGRVPYTFADSELIAEWRRKLDDIGGFQVAINWRGESGKPDAGGRAVPLELFASLAQIHGVRLISVHKGAGEDELAAAGDSVAVMNLGKDIDTAHGPFMDTAAIMKNVDLVITSDTATVHLAGSLGVPVWVALRSVANWPWLLNRDDTPWYPTMRFFRQKTAGDWNGVFDEIRVALSNLVSTAR